MKLAYRKIQVDCELDQFLTWHVIDSASQACMVVVKMKLV